MPKRHWHSTFHRSLVINGTYNNSLGEESKKVSLFAAVGYFFGITSSDYALFLFTNQDKYCFFCSPIVVRINCKDLKPGNKKAKKAIRQPPDSSNKFTSEFGTTCMTVKKVPAPTSPTKAFQNNPNSN